MMRAFYDMRERFSMITKAGFKPIDKALAILKKNALSLFFFLSVLIFSRIGTDFMRQRLNDRRSSNVQFLASQSGE